MTWPGDFFFNQVAFIKRRSSDKIVSFPTNTPMPLIYFTQIGDELISLHKSTFGGFIIKNGTTGTELKHALAQGIDWCKTNQISRITIRLFPEPYHQAAAKLSTDVLSSFSFSELYVDVTQILPVTAAGLRMNVHRRRRLKHCMNAGYRFRQLSKNDLADAYGLFIESRNQKGYPITMTLADFEQSFEDFQDQYLLFGVIDSGHLIAACVCVRVAPEILYTFFIGDSIRYRKQSPVTQLLAGVYAFAQQNNIQIVDLGISTDKGIINEGLYRFKKSFGTVDGIKKTYQLKL